MIKMRWKHGLTTDDVGRVGRFLGKHGKDAAEVMAGHVLALVVQGKLEQGEVFRLSAVVDAAFNQESGAVVVAPKLPKRIAKKLKALAKGEDEGSDALRCILWLAGRSTLHNEVLKS